MGVRKKHTAMRHRRVSEFYSYWLNTPDGKKASHRKRFEMFDLIADNEVVNDEIRDEVKSSGGSTKARKSYHRH